MNSLRQTERELRQAVDDEIKLSKKFKAVQWVVPYGIRAAWTRFANAVDAAGFNDFVNQKEK